VFERNNNALSYIQFDDYILLSDFLSVWPNLQYCGMLVTKKSRGLPRREQTRAKECPHNLEGPASRRSWWMVMWSASTSSPPTSSVPDERGVAAGDAVAYGGGMDGILFVCPYSRSRNLVVCFFAKIYAVSVDPKL
jgi:hypothetical protein